MGRNVILVIRRGLAMAGVRLRIPLILLLVWVVVWEWEGIVNWWEMVTRRGATENIALHAVSSDTEYFCPMDPGVQSDWPGRCGVCNMALVRRKRGEAVMLPEGVVARMQLSPYRIQLAGIRTEPVVFERLVREISAPGIVTRPGQAAVVTVEFAGRERPYLVNGGAVSVTSPDLPGHDPFEGKLRKLTADHALAWHFVRAEVEVEGRAEGLCEGMMAVVRVRTPVAEIEPFRSLPADPPAYSASESKRFYRCREHPEKIAAGAGRCAIDGKRLESVALQELERLRWWCPMHPGVTAERAGAVCGECGGMALEPRVVSYRPAGRVLAVAESAVVDTGDRKIVFVEQMPGLFEGVEVVVGKRCGDQYPVVRGLEAGQRVVIAGAFLLDAETRLNPGLAGSYFGASRGERVRGSAGGGSSGERDRVKPTEGVAAVPLAMGELDPGDRVLAERQKNCPVTGMKLGSMGQPRRVNVEGHVLFVCCDLCKPKLAAEPAKYLAKIGEHGAP